MSGESFNGTYVGRSISAFNAMLDTPMSNFQRESISLADVKDVKEFNNSKVISEDRFWRLVEKYKDELERWHYQGSKYALYAYRVGVAYFGKFKPSASKLEKAYYRAKKDEKIRGFVYGDAHGKNLSRTFKTESLARKAAMEDLKNHPKKEYFYVFKAYERKVSGMISKLIPETRICLAEIGQMKSMPKNQPKSYVVIPVYYYMWDATVSDPEYEWM